MYSFKNKKGVIFGSTGLLGSRLAKKLSELGADLILHGKSKEKLKKLDNQIKQLGKSSSLIEADLTDTNFYLNLQDIVLSRFEKLDFLINSVGKFNGLYPSTHLTHKMWNDLIELNLNSYWRSLKELEPLLKKSENPRVIFFSNDEISNGLAYYNVFSICKAAIKAFCRTYQDENKRLKICLNLVEIKNLNSGMSSNILQRRKISDKSLNLIVDQIINKCFFEDNENILINI
tara:strand:- start:458 stop:1153 length:696 start_codon:yes stop_codon:yes gene_type:complete